MSKNNINILVTGGAGYIGSHVCKELIQQGYNPIIFDKRLTQFPYLEENTISVQGNILDTEHLTATLKEYKPEAVIHMAASIAADESVFKPDEYFENNVTGTKSVLEAMIASGIKNIIFSSTAAVYGMPEEDIVNEQSKTLPINPYGETKLTAENMIKDMARSHNLNWITFRYFNAVGSDAQKDVGNTNKEPKNLLPIILQVASDERATLNIYGSDYNTKDGTAIRDYVHVSDLATAHCKALALLKTDHKNQIINLGSGTGYTVLEMVETARKITAKEILISMQDRRAGDPEKSIASVEKAQNILSWYAQNDLNTIMKDSWDWHLHQLNN